MALFWTGYADAVIGCFDAKYTCGFWRPETAVTAGGGNSDLTADTGWLAVGTTPNHPEYPVAHGSTAFQDCMHTHVFEDTLLIHRGPRDPPNDAAPTTAASEGWFSKPKTVNESSVPT